MKVLVLSVLVAAAAADSYGGRLGAHSGSVRGSDVGGIDGTYGLGSSLDYYSTPDYNTAYSVKDAYSGVDIDSQESRLGDRTEGSYSTQLPDGRKQVVTYWVDGNSGYNADVQYYGVAQHPQTPIFSYGRVQLDAGGLGYGGVNVPAYGGGRGFGFGRANDLAYSGAGGVTYRGAQGLRLGRY